MIDKKHKKIISDLAGLLVLYIRYTERNTEMRFPTSRSIVEVIIGNNACTTYKEAVESLYTKINDICSDNNILGKLEYLKNEILESSLSQLKVSLSEDPLSLSDEELALDRFMLIEILNNLNVMVSIKDASEYFDVDEATIKQACQQERLLNTKKLSRMWLVHLDEVKKYWNKS